MVRERHPPPPMSRPEEIHNRLGICDKVFSNTRQSGSQEGCRAPCHEQHDNSRTAAPHSHPNSIACCSSMPTTSAVTVVVRLCSCSGDTLHASGLNDHIACLCYSNSKTGRDTRVSLDLTLIVDTSYGQCKHGMTSTQLFLICRCARWAT